MSQLVRTLCVGEVVVDLFEVDGHPNTYVRLMGGSPGNTGIGLSVLGSPATVFAAVGSADPQGQFLMSEMKGRGVDTSGVAVLGVPTTQSWISLDLATGQRFFNFVPSAHDRISLEHVRRVDYTTFGVMHMTSVLQANPEAAAAIDVMLELCESAGVIVSFDPNLRPTLWGDVERMHEYVRVTIPKSHIVKVSDEELAALLGMSPEELVGEHVTDEALNAATSKLFGGKNVLFTVTRGARGSFWKSPTAFGSVLTISTDVVDTTGAGDAFDAALINGLAMYIVSGALEVSDAEIPGIVRRACVFASLSTRAKGAVAGLPTLDELNAYLNPVA